MRARSWLVALVALAGCGGDGDGAPRCAEGERSLAIADPVDGQTIGPADDADPSMSNVQYDVGVRSCGFDADEMIEIHLLDPVDVAYAYVAAGDGEATTRVPLLPGMNRLRAQDRDAATQSTEVAFTVETGM